MASSFGDALEVMLLNWAFTDAEAPTRPNAWYISLHTGDDGVRLKLSGEDGVRLKVRGY